MKEHKDTFEIQESFVKAEEGKEEGRKKAVKEMSKGDKD